MTGTLAVGGGLLDAAPPITIPPQTPGTIVEYNVPLNTLSQNIEPGPDRHLWFSLENGPRQALGRCRLDGYIRVYDLGPAGNLAGIRSGGPDGRIWFAENDTISVGRIEVDGSNYTRFGVPSTPGGLVWSPQGYLYVVSTSAAKIFKLNTAGSLLATINTTGVVGPHGPNIGIDGRVYVCGLNNGTVGVLDPTTDTFSVFASGMTNQPYVISRDAQNANYWVTRLTGGLSKVTPAGVVSNVTLPFGTDGTGLCPDTLSGDGIYMVQKQASRLNHVTGAGVVDMTIACPTAGAGPDKVVIGPDGGVWFTEHDVGKIARYQP
jgi:streptogramin lyase